MVLAEPVKLLLAMEERLLVLRGLGIQTSTGAATVLGRPTTRFIPTEKIRDVLVAEAGVVMPGVPSPHRAAVRGTIVLSVLVRHHRGVVWAAVASVGVG